MLRVPPALTGLVAWCSLRLFRRLALGAVVLATAATVVAWAVTLSPVPVADGVDRPLLDVVATSRTDGATAFLGWVVHLASTELAAVGTVVLFLEVGVRRRRWDVVVPLVVAVWGAFTVSGVVKFLTLRIRPESDLAVVDAVGPAFPSGHVVRAVALYGVLAWLLAARLPGFHRTIPWAVAGTVVVAVGVGRVYLGAHWLTDVVAGGVISATWTVFALHVLRRERDEPAAPWLTRHASGDATRTGSLVGGEGLEPPTSSV